MTTVTSMPIGNKLGMEVSGIKKRPRVWFLAILCLLIGACSQRPHFASYAFLRGDNLVVHFEGDRLPRGGVFVVDALRPLQISPLRGNPNNVSLEAIRIDSRDYKVMWHSVDPNVLSIPGVDTWPRLQQRGEILTLGPIPEEIRQGLLKKKLAVYYASSLKSVRLVSLTDPFI